MSAARTPRLSGLVHFVPLVLLASALPVPQPEPAALQQEPARKAGIGELVPEHVFRDFLAGGDGRQRLSEFRGQPVLVVNFTDTDFGLGAADGVEKLAKELVPKGLVLVLIETREKPAAEVEACVMRLYPGSPARVSQNQVLPIEYQDNGFPPFIALIGVDGTLLLAGSYTADLSKASKLVPSELKRAKAGWGKHDAARTARAMLYGQGRLSAALETLESASSVEPEEAELREARAELTAHLGSRLRSVRYFMERGRCLRALDEARALAQLVKGMAEAEREVAALLAELEGEAARTELELERKLGSLLVALEKKLTQREVEKLRKFAAEAGPTRVGERARHLAEIAALAARK